VASLGVRLILGDLHNHHGGDHSAGGCAVAAYNTKIILL